MTSARSLESQDETLRHVQQILQNQQNDRNLDAKIDEILQAQEGWGSLAVDLLSLLVSSGRTSQSRNALQSTRGSLMNDLVKAVDDIQSERDLDDLELSEARKKLLEKKFIAKLEYEGMYDRENYVESAHELTFRWVFERPHDRSQTWDDFRQWLRSEEQLYWITGKPGSGKSTLMKFISLDLGSCTVESSSDPTESQRRCNPYLLEWAKGQPLVVATFYFWAGTKDSKKFQTSKDGLYRTLLSQIIKACPEAIPLIAPERWESLCMFNEDPRSLRMTDLRGMLTRAVKYCASKMKLCLFIDGLDEFEGQPEDLQELVGWVMATIATAPIKICVASRPWRVFEDALDDKPNLRLENLTYDDIKDYVTNTFEEDSEYNLLRKREPVFADQLIEEIVLKASGVFLWVRLVCANLLNGIMDGDGIADLMKRLSELPPELEGLYDRILESLEPRHQSNAAQYFFLMLACPQTPPAILFYFSDDINDTPNRSINMADAPLSKDDLEYRTRQVRNRLNSRCKGLIFATKPKPNVHSILKTVTVQYLHRSVKDFMEKRSGQDKLLAMLEAPFDPYSRLCSASLAMWKIRPRASNRMSDGGSEDADESSFARLLDVLIYATHAYPENIKQVDRVVEEVERSMMQDESAFPGVSRFLLTNYKDTFPLDPDMGCYGNNFLSLNIKFNAAVNVSRKLTHGCIVDATGVHAPSRIRQYSPKSANKHGFKAFAFLKRNNKVQTTSSDKEAAINPEASSKYRPWPLLLDALFSNTQPIPEMVFLLLKNGADPNHTVSSTGTTVFVEALACAVACVVKGPSLKAWDDVLQLMVKHGASIEPRTIDRALRLASTEHHVSPQRHRLTTNGLHKMLKDMRFGTKGPRPTLRSSQSTGNVVVHGDNAYQRRMGGRG